MTEMLIIDDVINSMDLISINGIDFKTKFDFGNINNLQEFVTNNKGKNIYPLIFCSNDYYLSELENGLLNGDITFVIATVNQDFNMSNVERLKTTFENVIKPCYKEFVKQIENSNQVFKNSRIFDATNFYGYDVKKEYSINLGLNEYWDAYKFTVNLSFKNCD